MGFFDLALVFDASRRRADLALAGGDLAVDLTALTPMLVSLGIDARARSDDPLPIGLDDLNRGAGGFDPRRGFAGDALVTGDDTGSRLWQLEREKQTEGTRLRALEHAVEALDWAEAETGREAEVSAVWLRANVLGLTARVGGDTVDLAVGGG